MRIATVVTRRDSGGAFRVASELHNEYLARGHDARMIVLDETDGPLPYLRSFRLKLGAYMRRQVLHWSGLPPGTQYSFGANRTNHWRKIDHSRFDIVHYHNVFTWPTKSAKVCNTREFWTLHDAWIFTGGCHVPDACRLYESGCAKCPLFNRTAVQNLVAQQAKTTREWVKKNRIKIIAPSEYIASHARSVFPETSIRVLGNPVDTRIFYPATRRWDGSRRPVILVGANFLDVPAKGLGELHYLLRHFPHLNEYEWRAFGRIAQPQSFQLPGNVKHLGASSDPAVLRNWYAEADIFLTLSRSETFGLTLAESNACGTPVVGWRVGGTDEVVGSMGGELVERGDYQCLATALEKWAKSSAERRESRTSLLNPRYSLNSVIESHLEAYMV